MEDRYTPTPGPYGLRLCRAAGLVALGAAIHVLLPQGKPAPVALTSPLKVARVDAQEERRPALRIEQTTVFAPFAGGDLGHALALRAPVHRPVGTTGAATLLISTNPQPEAFGEEIPYPALATDAPQQFDFDPDRLPIPNPRVHTRGDAEAIAGGAMIDDPVARTARMASAWIGTPLPEVVPEVRADIAAVPALAEPAAAAEPLEPRATAVRAAAVNSVSDETLVRRLLDEYAGAFERLDVSATKAVWPSVNDKALERAYGQLASQRLTLQGCGIIISGSTANARCQGSATYQPRIGKRAVVASREWTFDLTKKDADWRIVALR